MGQLRKGARLRFAHPTAPCGAYDGRKKSAGENPRRIVIVLRSRGAPYAFIAAFTASAVIGRARTRAPQALKMALPIAGAITVTAGSPPPGAFSPLAITAIATSGTWLMRKGV